MTHLREIWLSEFTINVPNGGTLTPWAEHNRPSNTPLPSFHLRLYHISCMHTLPWATDILPVVLLALTVAVTRLKSTEMEHWSEYLKWGVGLAAVRTKKRTSESIITMRYAGLDAVGPAGSSALNRTRYTTPNPGPTRISNFEITHSPPHQGSNFETLRGLNLNRDPPRGAKSHSENDAGSFL